jgi:hypothetical protein
MGIWFILLFYPREILIESTQTNKHPVVCAKRDNQKRPKCDNRPPGSEKTPRHIPAAVHCASQPPGNHPTPSTNLQQKTQTALSRRPDH